MGAWRVFVYAYACPCVDQEEILAKNRRVQSLEGELEELRRELTDLRRRSGQYERYQQELQVRTAVPGYSSRMSSCCECIFACPQHYVRVCEGGHIRRVDMVCAGGCGYLVVSFFSGGTT